MRTRWIYIRVQVYVRILLCRIRILCIRILCIRTRHTALYLSFYEVWGEVLHRAAAQVRLFLVKMLRFIVVQRTISRLCFGRCGKQLQIRLQKHDENEQQRKSAGLNMTETWLDISVPETWRNYADLNFHVSARRKYNGTMELHVSATFQKYGNMQFRPVWVLLQMREFISLRTHKRNNNTLF